MLSKGPKYSCCWSSSSSVAVLAAVVAVVGVVTISCGSCISAERIITTTTRRQHCNNNNAPLAFSSRHHRHYRRSAPTSRTRTAYPARSSSSSSSNNNQHRYPSSSSFARCSTASSSADTTAAATASMSPANTDKKKKIIDQSTFLLLEHVNINVPSHEYILPFYYEILGMGMDPRKAANLKPDAAKKTLWANCGASQFHLPYDSKPQVIPGQIGLRYNDLEGLHHRLRKYEEAHPNAADKCYTEFSIETDPSTSKPTSIRIMDRYGNVFVCRTGGNPVHDTSLRQPVIRASETAEWDDIASRFGLPADDADAAAETECRGIDYVEFYTRVGTAEKIALFYDTVFDVTTSVVDVVDDQDTKVAIIAFGNVDEDGRADQTLLFRETSDASKIPAEYDGHHVAMYVGATMADYEQAYRNAETAGVVWINPRFSDKSDTLELAKANQQFRFKNIVDMKTGKTILQLEHEMRSVQHEAWPGRGQGGE